MQPLTDPVRAAAAAVVEDLQAQGPDLGWPEASNLVDALVDTLSHLVVDLGAGAEVPSPHPEVIGAVGGVAGPVDAPSCRTCAASLRRAAHLLANEGSAAWPQRAAEVALDLADLLEQCADLARSARLAPTHKAVVIRRLRALQRSLAALAVAEAPVTTAAPGTAR